MSQKEGSQNNDVFTRELFDSSSSNGSTTATSTGGSSCSSSSLECSSSGLSSPLALPCGKLAEPPLQLQYTDTKLSPPPLKLQLHADSKRSPPLKLQSPHNKPSSSPSALLRYPRKLEHDNGAVKRSMGLMKLRRQGSHPPTPGSRISSNKSCAHGNFNQAAAARELMARLEKLSMKETTMGTKEEREREAQMSLLAGESVNAAASSRNAGMQAELPLTAKIAAAMDAEGLIGVQEEISLKWSDCRIQLRSFSSDQYSPPSSSFKIKSRKPRTSAAGSCCRGEQEMRRVAVRKMHSTLSHRRSRWIILRRLRSTRTLLGKIWMKFKRVFSS